MGGGGGGGNRWLVVVIIRGGGGGNWQWWAVVVVVLCWCNCVGWNCVEAKSPEARRKITERKLPLPRKIKQRKQELFVSYIYTRRVVQFKLVIRNLVYADYYHCGHLFPQNDTMANIIKLSAPNVEAFSCKSFLTQDYSLEISSPLLVVYFYMTLNAEKEDENAETYEKLPSKEKAVYAKRMMKFLRAVYMVQALRLSPGFLEVLSQDPDLLDCQPPLLHSLLFLVLEIWPTRGCLRAMAYLLKVSPNIARLVLVSKESKLADVGDGWEAGLSLPGMLSHLRFVRIEEVEGCDAELKLLSFLLKNAKFLEEVVLKFRSNNGSPEGVRQFQEKLRLVPTASSSIQMVFKT
ncbi:hypothetical protein C5167_000319 [Papaver somniferum]|uniref:FBD domain-containing protein n=2 Tax=Papaver somniferum TaxID=3469 RepID=A0A4Y7KW95_PAPSO|nr:hypothetical protein C5167_000319 [Papaver somniferum]